MGHDIYAALGEIFSEVFNRDIELRPDMTATDVPGWDSFKQIEIIMACQERFKFSFSAREMNDLQCVADLAQVVARRTANA